jgi:hypothetical protein
MYNEHLISTQVYRNFIWYNQKREDFQGNFDSSFEIIALTQQISPGYGEKTLYLFTKYSADCMCRHNIPWD